MQATIMATIILTGAIASGCSFIKNDDLNQAALTGNQARCETLLRKGANVNGAGMHGMKPIMLAAKGGHRETVSYLVSKGADVNAHNDSGSALMWAVDSGDEELMQFLLSHGADPSWTNALGQTALDLAADKHRTNLVSILQKWPKKDERSRNAAAPHP